MSSCGPGSPARALTEDPLAQSSDGRSGLATSSQSSPREHILVGVHRLGDAVGEEDNASPRASGMDSCNSSANYRPCRLQAETMPPAVRICTSRVPPHAGR